MRIRHMKMRFLPPHPVPGTIRRDLTQQFSEIGMSQFAEIARDNAPSFVENPHVHHTLIPHVVFPTARSTHMPLARTNSRAASCFLWRACPWKQ